MLGTAGTLGLTGSVSAKENLWHADSPAPKDPERRANRIGMSTYCFWHFRGEKLGMKECIDHAARMGFDGVELLHVQMKDDSNSALQKIKRQCHTLGLDLMGFSTHQGFVYPDKAKRDREIAKTKSQVEKAHELGIPTMRINTGRWGLIGFDELMKNKGIEPRLEGYSDDDGFEWVIDSIEKILPTAEKNGVVLGLENHWGLGRTAQGVLRIAEAIDSPWLGLTLDTGNFLENQYEQFEAMTLSKIPLQLIQAKTYFGGGRWYELDIDYARIARMLKKARYRGYISLEFEGNEDAITGVPKSLALLRKHFA